MSPTAPRPPATPTNTGSQTRRYSSMSSNPQSDARERLEQCPLCGEPYAAGRFQVLLLGDLESFDCIECAMEELRRRRVMRRLKPELSTIESLTAELFAVKAQLESERRMS